MKFLLLNQDWFADDLRSLGHQVVTAGARDGLMVFLEPLTSIREALDKELRGFSPDVIVWFDNSAPLYFKDIETLGALTIFYSVDAHHHASSHRHIAHLFDVTLVAQKDYIPVFVDQGVTPHWFPLWISKRVPPQPKELDAVFVGTLDRKLNPARVDFFEALQKKVPILVTGGAWWEFFAKAELVVNQTVKQDLNFRVFEVLGSGALLLTEKTGNGLFELFQDGEHLLSYSPNNVDEAAEKITFALSHREKARTIARQGHQEALLHHTSLERAKALVAIIDKSKKEHPPLRQFGVMVMYHQLAKHSVKQETGDILNYLHLARVAARRALEAREPLNEDLGLVLLSVITLRPPIDEELLELAAQKFPRLSIVLLGKVFIANKLNRLEEQQSLLSTYFPGEEEASLEKMLLLFKTLSIS